jgi:hypothetical protein
MEYLGKLIVLNNLIYILSILSAFVFISELVHSFIFLLRCIPTFNAIQTLKKYQSHHKYQQYKTLYPNISWIKKYLAGTEQGKIYNVKFVDRRFVLLDYPDILQLQASLSRFKRARIVCIISGWIIVVYQIAYIVSSVYNKFYSQVGYKPTDKFVLFVICY